MATYDFSTINDKDFERLAVALLSQHFGERIERFKPGKDQGVDGRFFASASDEVVIQCKHWLRSGVSKLVAHLAASERSKVARLNPARYVLVTSLPLSPGNKRSIRAAVSPHIGSPSDIFGAEDLNDLIARYPHIEQAFPELWMPSTNVLQRVLNTAIWGHSEWQLVQAQRAACRYVRTSKHDEAIAMLQAHGVVIVTGVPGIGKTTLANQLCLEMAADEFQMVSIGEDVHDAEQVFDDRELQVFLFDDFLGRNYLAALRRNEDSRIVQFIERVRNSKKSKRLILTSRTNILNQGKRLSDQFRIANIEQREFELCVEDLSSLEKAKILYNHLWFGDMDPAFAEQLHEDRRYLRIVRHENFSPRLVEFITDQEKLHDTPIGSYWQIVQDAFDNPADVWDKPFNATLTARMRAIVILVTLNAAQIDESSLRKALTNLVSLHSVEPDPGELDFFDSIKILSGSLLNRTLVVATNTATLDLFSPSIGDYVLSRYLRDDELICAAFVALDTVASLRSIRGLASEGQLDRERCESVLERLSAKLESEIDLGYRIELASMILDGDDASAACAEHVRAFVSALLRSDLSPDLEDISSLLLKALGRGVVGVSERGIVDLYLSRPLVFSYYDATTEFSALYESLDQAEKALIADVAGNAISEFWGDYADEWVVEGGILTEYVEEHDAHSALDRALREEFGQYPSGIAPDEGEIAERIDTASIVEQNRYEAERADYEMENARDRGYVAAPVDQEAAIHDLFEWNRSR